MKVSGVRKMRDGLNYANVVATVALCVALGGGAYAASNAPKNSVDSKSVENEALTGKDVKANSLKGGDVDEATLGQVQNAASALGVAANSVTGAGVVDNSLTGSDLDETSFGQVPLAAEVADNSIIGASVVDNSLGGTDVDEASLALPAAPNEATPISRRQPPSTAFETLFEAHGLRVEAECSATGGGTFRFDLLEAAQMGVIRLSPPGNLQVSGQTGPANNAGTTSPADADASVQGIFNYRRQSDGKVVSLYLSLETANVSVGSDCSYFGTALAEG